MIIFKQNIPYPEQLKELLLEDEFSEKYFDRDRNISTTFEKSIDYKFLGEDAKKYYSSMMDSLMKIIGLYDYCQYDWHYWYQIYNKNSEGHDPHLHFSGKEILSWVHFISVTDCQSFYFQTGDGKKKVNEQDGDLIVFPSWCIHGVEKFNSDNKRVIAAGNISLNLLSDPTGENNLCYDERTNGYNINPTISFVEK